MLSIEQIEEMLGYSRFLPLPENIIITKEPVYAKVDGVVLFRGLQPKFKKDTIILTPHATSETVFHEIVHTLGFGEKVAYPLGKLLDLKYKIRKNLPMVLKRNVNYEKCNGCEEFVELHTNYADKAEHYRLR